MPAHILPFLSRTMLLLVIVIVIVINISCTGTLATNTTTTTPALNVIETPLKPCSLSPLTGYFRDGLCRTTERDVGRHVICVEATREFLDFSQGVGNDLSTPHPPSFPGLKPGDRWCVCALRWKQAFTAGINVNIDLEATDVWMLNVATLEELASANDKYHASCANPGAPTFVTTKQNVKSSLGMNRSEL